jgi:hypothetical protein
MRTVLAAALCALATVAYAGDTHVNGYFRNDGSYVQPHYRSAPDSSTYNNYSTQGNVNPYTGQAGTHNPYQMQQPSTGYGTNYIGPRR